MILSLSLISFFFFILFLYILFSIKEKRGANEQTRGQLYAAKDIENNNRQQ
jgi:cbb3-type cytochrome oxidase subunit 3